MNISPVSNVSYGQIASGNRLTSAAVSPTDLKISEKMQSQVNGLNQGSNNIKDGISALKISDGALEGITNNLQRVHELSIKASNGLMSSDDKKAIQNEISGLFDDINKIAGNTQFNEKKLISGEGGINIASNSDGSGISVSDADSTIKALGLDGYNVEGNFDISKVTDALAKVTSQRSRMGAETNSLEHAYNVNSIAAENVMSSKSQIADLDMPKAISDQKKQELLDTFQIMMQRRMQEDEANKNARFFTGM